MEQKPKPLNLVLEYACNTMKKTIYILITILIVSCSKEDANDCIQSAGTTIQQDVSVSNFSKILVNRDIKLVIKEAPDFSVIIETGEYLFNDVEAKVVDEQLQLSNTNTCNFVRDYGLTTIYVSAPDITEIRSSTQHSIVSDGTLNYNDLRLFSEDFNGIGTITSGNFRLDVNTDRLRIVSNNLSSFHITGEVENLFVRFFSGIGRFEGRNLMAQTVEIYHRGGNDIIVNPQEALTGNLFGTGNLVSINRPNVVDVVQHYTGELIFE